MKKFASLLMTVVLLATTLTVFAVPASAEEQAIPNSSLTWELTDNNTRLIIAGKGAMPDYNNKTYKNCPWANAAETVTTVQINSGITTLGNYAFYQFGKMTSVTIPDGVTSIGKNAFECCSSLTSVTIPSGVTSIGDNAFGSCSSLTSVTIPSGVTSIGDNAFNRCTSLKELTIPGSVVSIGNSVFEKCGQLTAVTIPGSVVSIRESAFANCGGITTLTISDGVQSIGAKAFQGCDKIANVTIPGTVTNIGTNAFDGCPHLVINGLYGSAADQYALENGVTFKGEGTCSHIFCLVCDSCHKSLTKSDLLNAWGYSTGTASTLSEGSLTIILCVACSVVFLAVGFFIGTKKTKPALADGANNTDEE